MPVKIRYSEGCGALLRTDFAGISGLHLCRGVLLSISVAVLTHNEIQEFKWLMRALEAGRDVIDEIVIVDDFSDPEFVNLVLSYQARWPIRFFQRRLERNFSAQRNYAKAQCRGRLILFPDADEVPSKTILLGLPKLLLWMENNEVDLCYLPRLNLSVEEETDDPVKALATGNAGAPCIEDQPRIIRNLPAIRWILRVNEGIYGARRYYKFPHDQEFFLLHAKTNSRVKISNKFYSTIKFKRLERHLESIAKRTIRWRRPRLVSLEPPL
jgi:glycosyltransferase involved in cell wall biosynthesis